MNDGGRASVGRTPQSPSSLRRWIIWGAEAVTVVAFLGMVGDQLGFFSDLSHIQRPTFSPFFLEVVAILLGARLAGLLWAPGGTPPSFLRPLQERIALLRPRERTGGLLHPWQRGGWRFDAAIAAGLLLITAAVHWMAMARINPEGWPGGSDHHTFRWNTWLLLHNSWAGYHPDKFPGYPWLTAQLTRIGGMTMVQGLLAASRGAIFLGILGVYAAVRLTLGRRVAVTACLLLAFSPLAHHFANATTSYSLFAAAIALYAAALASALFFRKPLPWLAAGLAIGVAHAVDVKALTVAALSAPAVVLAVVWSLRAGARRGDRLGSRLGAVAMGPGLGLAVGVLSMAAVYLAPVDFTSLRMKLNTQAFEILRESQPGAIMPDINRADIPMADLPPLQDRVRSNLVKARGLLPQEGWLLILPLALLGCLAPLVARGAMGLRHRVLGMVGPALMLMVLASTAGAFVLIYYHKYAMHAWPFFLALAAAGAWVVAGWAVPARAPRLLFEACGWAIVACLVAAVVGHDSMRSAIKEGGGMELRQRGRWTIPKAEHLGTGREVARWLSDHRPLDETLILCEEGLVAQFLPRAVDLPLAGNALTSQCSPPASHSSVKRTWVVETNRFREAGKRILSDPARFEVVLRRSLGRIHSGDASQWQLVVAVERGRQETHGATPP